jgi:hypothetical protein
VGYYSIDQSIMTLSYVQCIKNLVTVHENGKVWGGGDIAFIFSFRPTSVFLEKKQKHFLEGVGTQSD